MASNRIGRINEEIQRELAELIRSLKDPRVQTMISITRVDTTPDLRYSKIYVSALWQNEQKKSRPPPCLMPAIRNFYPAPACRAGAGYVILSCKTPMERTIFPCNMM